MTLALNVSSISLIVGNGLTTLGIALFSLFTDTSPFGYLYGFIIIAGTGSGMIYACSTVAAQSACDPKDLGMSLKFAFFRISTYRVSSNNFTM
jgi:hypothetical protein